MCIRDSHMPQFSGIQRTALHGHVKKDVCRDAKMRTPVSYTHLFLIGKQDDNQRAKAIITNIYAFIAAVSTIVLIIGFRLMGSLPLWIRLSICLYYFFDIVSNVSRQVIRGLGRNMDYTVSAIISGCLLYTSRGEMSIIGPRAVPIFYAERMTQRHKMLCAVRPGLECPRVIDLKSNGEISNYLVTFENNIWYVENVSFMTDLRMVFILIKMVFTFKERTVHADAASFFVGYDDEGRAISMKLAQKYTAGM